MLAILLMAATCAGPEVKIDETTKVPTNFVEYFERSDMRKKALFAKAEEAVSAAKIAVRSEPSSEFSAKNDLTSRQAFLKDVRKMKPYALADLTRVGSVGFFIAMFPTRKKMSDPANVIAVIDNKTVIVRCCDQSEKLTYAVLKVDSSKGVSTITEFSFRMQDDPQARQKTPWVVLSLDGRAEMGVSAILKAKAPAYEDSVPVLEQVNFLKIDKYRKDYDLAKTAAATPVQPGVADNHAESPLSDEFRSYFDRSYVTHAELVADSEKKIADLQKAVDSDETLAADKQRMNVELTLAKANLTQLKRAKPFANLRRQPVVGDLCTLQKANVAATHDVQSVIVTVADAPTVRLTEVDAKSLGMKVGAKVDEDEVWQVVNVDEKPNDAIAESLKVVRLVVLKRIKYADLERHRATYEAAKKATENP